MLISPAYAQAGGDPTGGLMSLLPLVLIFVVFYFILIRPQQKKAKDHRLMLADLKRGDKVVTGGGVLATVVRVTAESEEVIVEIAKDLRIRIVKGTIQSVLRDPAAAPPKQDNRPEPKPEPKAPEPEPKAEEPAPANDITPQKPQ